MTFSMCPISFYNEPLKKWGISNNIYLNNFNGIGVKILDQNIIDNFGIKQVKNFSKIETSTRVIKLNS